MAETKSLTPLRRAALVVRGVVQGVGFRPFVYNAARSLALSGWVLNEADLVRIEVQGAPDKVAAFLDALQKQPPPQAKIDSLEIRDIACHEEQSATFEIRASDAASSPGPTIPADLATCADCLAEIFNPAERRFHYPFTNCTNCGPRWSIIEQLPYDRPRTSMKHFVMCDRCRAEYENPADRRFHAQPIACPDCGPHLQLLDAQGKKLPSPFGRGAGGEGQVLRQASIAVTQGKILALKGLGGFQLIADATSAVAVALLRERKKRPDRPFALMMRSLEEVRKYCEVSEEEAEMLASHRAPIVLLRKHSLPSPLSPVPCSPSPVPCPLSPVPCPLAPNVAPGNPYLGVMLPYTPLHHLLMAALDRPIVCTSGNLSEEPMVISIEEALARLGHVADLFLTHDRPIVRPVDDSIIRIGPLGMQVLRRARGFAPLPVAVRNLSARTILALGGHLKNTVALCLNDTTNDQRPTTNEPFVSHSCPTIISAHIGDLDSAASRDVFRKAIDDLAQFYQVRPDVVACDLHPDYASTRQAESLAKRWSAALVRVQHHHAHLAACMAEHDLAGPVLGFAWDGTGYGTEGTIWGGEAMVCRGADFSRAAHLRTFALPGGDAAARRPRRSALGLLFEIFGEEAARYVQGWFPPDELKALMQMLRRNMNCPRTSSMGRLFDAVSAIAGLSHAVTFEGQAAMALEFVATDEEQSAYPLPLLELESGVLSADWEPMIRQILAELSAGETVGRISERFHNTLVEMAVEIAKVVGLQQIVLSGGCFQNALLLRRTYLRLSEAGFQVFLPQQVPPGDGGIALGQVFIAGLKPTIE